MIIDYKKDLITEFSNQGNDDEIIEASYIDAYDGITDWLYECTNDWINNSLDDGSDIYMSTEEFL